MTMIPGAIGEASQDPWPGSPAGASTSPDARWRIVDRPTIETYGLRSVSEAVGARGRIHDHRLLFGEKPVRGQRGGRQPNFSNRVLVMIEGVPACHTSTGEGSLDRVSISG